MKKSDRARFFGKNLVWPKLGKKGPKMDVFNFFSKLSLRFCLEIAKNEASYFYLITVKTTCPEKIWFSRYYGKALDQSDCLIFQIAISFEPLDRFL